MAETGSSSAESKGRSSRGLSWLVVLAAFLAAVVGAIAPRLVFGFAGRTVWDYLDVFLVPVAVGAATALIAWKQSSAEAAQQKRERKAEEDRKERERKAQEAQRKRALEVENQRAQDAALQAYLDQMSQLLLKRDDKGLLISLNRNRNGPSSPPVVDAENMPNAENMLILDDEGIFIRALIRARTLTVLGLFNSDRPTSSRKGRVLQFLYESGLIKRGPENFIKLGGPMPQDAQTGRSLPSVPSQSVADLSRADVRRMRLSQAYLRGTKLSRADLSDADLTGADLKDANLFHATLTKANIRGAILTDADLRKANLSGADLTQADLTQADLSGADLRGADLTGATGWTAEQLEQTASLEGTTMPDGQILKSDDNPDGPTFEEWLKSKGSGEQGENE